jgi:hypothetical protein
MFISIPPVLEGRSIGARALSFCPVLGEKYRVGGINVEEIVS